MSEALMMRRRALMQRKAGGGFSNEYTSVTSIAAKGGAFILTDFVPSNNTRVVATIEFRENSLPLAAFGARKDFASSSFTLFGFNNGTLGIDIGNRRTMTPRLLPLYEIDMSETMAMLNGQSIALPQVPTFTCPVPLAIFGVAAPGQGGPVVSKVTWMKLMSFDIYDGVDLVRSYRPAIRRVDGEPGLLETIGGNFLTNQGSGEFTYE